VRLFFNTKKDSSIQTSTGENIPGKAATNPSPAKPVRIAKSTAKGKK
jgi:hypothetical protein